MIKLSERTIKNALNRICEAHDYWADAENAYLTQERLPKGWEKIDREDDEPLYRDMDGNEYVKDEYGRFKLINEQPMDLEEEKNGIDYGEDFRNWAFSECDKKNFEVSGLIYDYIYEDNDEALYNLIEMYKEANGIQVEPDSQDDIWISEEIRRAIEKMINSEGGDQQECLNEAYGVGYQGQFIREKPGWGPTFTSFPQDAKKFNTPGEAQRYINQYLPDFGANVVSLPLPDDDDLEETKILGEGGDGELQPDKKYRVESGSSFRLGIVLTGEQINMGYHSGDCDADVQALMQMPEVRKQLDAIGDEELDKWWDDTYVDDTPEEHASADRERKLSWLVFDACANAIDGDFEEVVDEPSTEDIATLKEAIKSLIRESFANRGLFQVPMQAPGDMQEKGHTKKSKHSQANQHFKTNPKTARERRQTKRAIVIRWLRDPSVNCAEIMRLLWNPAPEDEDTKRGEFYKKRDGAINKDSGARYSFDDDEINSLYKIKSGRV